jgi:hypothetical protein
MKRWFVAVKKGGAEGGMCKKERRKMKSEGQ